MELIFLAAILTLILCSGLGAVYLSKNFDPSNQVARDVVQALLWITTFGAGSLLTQLAKPLF